MKALSLLPPGRRGEPRGWGRAVRAEVVLETVEEAGGESRKPPRGGEEVSISIVIEIGDREVEDEGVLRHGKITGRRLARLACE